MLDKETIKTLKLVPEVDMEKATKLQFTNSDKLASEVNLGTNPETFRVAYLATKVALDPSVRTTSQDDL